MELTRVLIACVVVSAAVAQQLTSIEPSTAPTDGRAPPTAAPASADEWIAASEPRITLKLEGVDLAGVRAVVFVAQRSVQGMPVANVSVRAADFASISTTSITLQLPAADAPGVYDVLLHTASGLMRQPVTFTYSAPRVSVWAMPCVSGPVHLEVAGQVHETRLDDTSCMRPAGGYHAVLFGSSFGRRRDLVRVSVGAQECVVTHVDHRVIACATADPGYYVCASNSSSTAPSSLCARQPSLCGNVLPCQPPEACQGNNVCADGSTSCSPCSNPATMPVLAIVLGTVLGSALLVAVALLVWRWRRRAVPTAAEDLTVSLNDTGSSD